MQDLSGKQIDSLKKISWSQRVREWDDRRKAWQVEFVSRLVRFVFLRRVEQKKIEPEKIKKVLFLRHDNKIGDSIVSTLIYRNLKAQWPHMEIHVVTGSEGSSVLEQNQFVNKVWLARRSLWQFARLGLQLRKLKVDMIVDFSRSLHPAVALLLGISKAPHRIGYLDGDCDLFTLIVRGDFFNKHITQKYASILEVLGAQSRTLDYDFPLQVNSIAEVDRELDKAVGRQYLLFNAFAGGKGRVLSDDSVMGILRAVKATLMQNNWSLILIAPPDQQKRALALAQQINKSLNIKTFYFSGLHSIHHLGRLVQLAAVVMTPDTSLVHMACAFHTPLVGLYRKDWPLGEQNCEVWAPLGTLYTRAFAREPLFQGEEVSINEVRPKDVAGALDVLILKIKAERSS